MTILWLSAGALGCLIGLHPAHSSESDVKLLRPACNEPQCLRVGHNTKIEFGHVALPENVAVFDFSPYTDMFCAADKLSDGVIINRELTRKHSREFIPCGNDNRLRPVPYDLWEYKVLVEWIGEYSALDAMSCIEGWRLPVIANVNLSANIAASDKRKQILWTGGDIRAQLSARGRILTMRDNNQTNSDKGEQDSRNRLDLPAMALNESVEGDYWSGIGIISGIVVGMTAIAASWYVSGNGWR